MGHDLECPAGPQAGWPDQLYRTRGSEVVSWRPVFTGDVFERKTDGTTKSRNYVVLQHPCALRTNGVDLVGRLLVAEARRFQTANAEVWASNGRIMPLPSLYKGGETGKARQAVIFEKLEVLPLEDLGTRIACLTRHGVNLLLQRWIRHNSRLVVPTPQIDDVTSAVFEEADLIEDWCTEANAAKVNAKVAASDCMTWLREDSAGQSRQARIEEPQFRSEVRREMRAELTKRY